MADLSVASRTKPTYSLLNKPKHGDVLIVVFKEHLGMPNVNYPENKLVNNIQINIRTVDSDS